MGLRLIQYTPTAADRKREYQMAELLKLAQTRSTHAAKRRLMRKYYELHKQRPPEYVVWLERSKGLTHEHQISESGVGDKDRRRNIKACPDVAR